jgi:hypothetical protein
MLARERKAVAEMAGEFLREAGMLLFVFLPLDAVFSGKPVGAMTLALGIAISLVFWILGVTVERLGP